MGKFKPGESGNPKGRPKGSKNKASEELRGFLADILNEDKAKIKKELGKLSGTDYLNTLAKLLQYVMPRLGQMQVTPGITVEEFLSWSDIEQRQYIQSLIENSNHEDDTE